MLLKMWYYNVMGKSKGSFYKMNTNTHKVCTKCGVRKERSEYHKDSSRNDGITAYCKECKLQINNNWRKNNPEEMKQSQRRTKRKLAYGILPHEYDQLLIDQDNKCAICKNNIGYEAAVDHDHNTGEIRGLLCSSCNKGLGFFKDNIKFLQNAILYLSQI